MATVLLVETKMPVGFLPPWAHAGSFSAINQQWSHLNFYLLNINLIVPLECAVRVVITLGVFGKASELV